MSKFHNAISLSFLLVFMTLSGCLSQNANSEVGAEGPEGPIGPQGPEGSEGPEGAMGHTGYNGSDGVDGQSGMDGEPGADGSSSLTRISRMEMGNSMCQSGGVLIEIGRDLNQNNILEDFEVENGSFICDGMDNLSSIINRTTSTNAYTWPSAGGNNHQTSNNPYVSSISKDSISRLEQIEHYTVGTLGTVVIRDGIGYRADWSGKLTAFDTVDGSEYWTTQVSSTYKPFTFGIITSAPVVTEDSVFVGDNTASIIKLDRDSGDILWKRQLDTNPNSLIMGDPVIVEDILIVGISSMENFDQSIGEGSQIDMTMRGSVAAISTDHGRNIWKTYTTSNQEVDNPLWGAGVGVWSSPAVDTNLRTVYIGTGQFYEPGNDVEDAHPSTLNDSDLSDSLIMLDLDNGTLLHHHQFTEGDIWGSQYPNGQDVDVGIPPILFDGYDSLTESNIPMVGVGDKNGTYKVFDRTDLSLIWESNLVAGSVLGGFQAGAAYGDGVLYLAAHEREDGQPYDSDAPPGQSAVYVNSQEGNLVAQTGSRTRIMAVNASNGDTIWERFATGALTYSPLVLANDILFHGNINGVLEAIDSDSGDVLYRTYIGGTDINGVRMHGATITSMSVIDDRLFVSSYGGVTTYGLAEPVYANFKEDAYLGSWRAPMKTTNTSIINPGDCSNEQSWIRTDSQAMLRMMNDTGQNTYVAHVPSINSCEWQSMVGILSSASNRTNAMIGLKDNLNHSQYSSLMNEYADINSNASKGVVIDDFHESLSRPWYPEEGKMNLSDVENLSTVMHRAGEQHVQFLPYLSAQHAMMYASPSAVLGVGTCWSDCQDDYSLRTGDHLSVTWNFSMTNHMAFNQPVFEAFIYDTLDKEYSDRDLRLIVEFNGNQIENQTLTNDENVKSKVRQLNINLPEAEPGNNSITIRIESIGRDISSTHRKMLFISDPAVRYHSGSVSMDVESGWYRAQRNNTAIDDNWMFASDNSDWRFDHAVDGILFKWGTPGMNENPVTHQKFIDWLCSHLSDSYKLCIEVYWGDQQWIDTPLASIENHLQFVSDTARLTDGMIVWRLDNQRYDMNEGIYAENRFNNSTEPIIGMYPAYTPATEGWYQQWDMVSNATGEMSLTIVDPIFNLDLANRMHLIISVNGNIVQSHDLADSDTTSMFTTNVSLGDNIRLRLETIDSFGSVNWWVKVNGSIAGEIISQSDLTYSSGSGLYGAMMYALVSGAFSGEELRSHMMAFPHPMPWMIESTIHA